MSTATTQVNIRVDADLKRKAEDVLGLLGETPAKLMRKVFEKVSRGARDAEDVLSVLGAADQKEGPLSQSRCSKLFNRIDSQHDELAHLLGCNLTDLVPLNDDEVAEALYDERLEQEGERMVWHA